jgi:hypothetical protein
MRCRLQILAALFIALSVPAQPATLSFHNSANFPLWTNNASGSGSNLMSGANAFRIGLYLARGMNQPESALGLFRMTTNIEAMPGLFHGGYPQFSADYAHGDYVTFQIRAWSLSGGSSYEEAALAAASNPDVLLGRSGLGFTFLVQDQVPRPLFHPTMPGLLRSGFEIGPLPEPSAWSLLGLAVSSCGSWDVGDASELLMTQRLS